MNKVAAPDHPSAGVTVTEDGNFELYYNPAWFASLSDTHRKGILKHEFYHLIFEHTTGRIEKINGKYSKMQNAAADMAINCYLKGEVPEDGWFAHNFGFEDGLSYEQYYELLQQKFGADVQGEGDEGDGEGEAQQGKMPGKGHDDHDGWGDSDQNGDGGDSTARDAARSIAKERLRDACRKGMDEAAKASAGFGNMPEDIRKMILRLINGGVDWRAILRNFIGQSQRSNRSNSIKRINRRFPYIHPGRKTNRTAHVAIAIDQSGSVDDELLALFFGELDSLSKLATFTVVPFDTRVGDKLVYEWKKGQKHECKRVMHGGTDFDAPTKWTNEHPEIDGLIVLTDMQAPAPVPCRVRRLWLTDEAGKESQYFKTNELVIPIKRKNH